MSATNSLFILRMFFSFEALPWRLLAEETSPWITHGHSSIKKPSNSFEFEICFFYDLVSPIVLENQVVACGNLI